MRVLLAGGGSGGSATPILAVASELQIQQPDVEMLFLGTHDGPEAALAAAEGIRYVGVSTGKLRRYWDTENVVDVGRIALGVGQSLNKVRRFKPDVGFGAGGFASVPPLAAAGLLRVPVLIHQQDVVPGLANKLLVPFAWKITVAMPNTVTAFPKGRTVLRGNPVRARVLEGRRDDAVKMLGLEPNVPLLLVTGGGTGALGLNRLVAAAAPALIHCCQIVHLTGRGRGVPTDELGPRYRQFEFLVDEMPHLLAGADLVLTRAGMGTLSELAALRKPAIVIPLPGSHQEANARAFGLAGAALVVDQTRLTAESLSALVCELLADASRRTELGRAISAFMPPGAAKSIASDVLALARRRH